jgi:molybdate transport system ATP-binding protein
MSLSADLALTRGDLELRVGLAVGPGEVVALLGPNGAGKSTTLQMLAGTLAPDGGRVELGGVTLDDVAAGVHVRPRDRRVGMVVQDYLLFPRMSVLENVAFGLRSRGMPRDRARAEARTWLTRMGLGGYERRRPGELSGGQAQRVALARALIVEPRLLLLDEPLAALDAGTRPAVRAELRRHLAGYEGCTLVVTHDPLEAMVLGDRVVVLERGRVVQHGPPADVARRPRTDYVARLVGLNLYRGHGQGHTVTLRDGRFSLAVADPVDGAVFVAFPPAAVALHAGEPAGSPRNTWAATIGSVQRHGDSLRIELDGPIRAAADVTPAAAAQLRLVPGARVWAAVKAAETRAYPA